MKQNQKKPVLVTGATGYVAGRLIPLLLDSGYKVRAMGRSIPKMKNRPWGQNPDVEMVKGDILNLDSLQIATKGCETIYYLVHSMISQKGKYRDADRIGAENMVKACTDQGVQHIIYLGGLGDIHHKNISKHLISRNEVGDILKTGPVPTTVLRAAMILGSGSASFEILRYLAERLPVMVTPKWVRMPTQPISITNVLGYLKGCLDHPETRGETFDIGGPDVVAYKDLFNMFAKVAGIPVPIMIPVPILTPRLSSLWIHLVTPVPATIAQPLTEGLSLPTTCTENTIHKIIPQKLIPCKEAITRALDRIQYKQVDTSWADAGQIQYPEWAHYGDSAYTGGTILSCSHKSIIQGRPKDIWKSMTKIGGRTGYFGADFLWKIRGWMDKLIGGVGLSRGRRPENALRVGDALDFWRVLEIIPNYRLLLLGEMKTPGEALLEISIDTLDNDQIEIIMQARFLPKGLLGILYWYSVYPLHQYVFTRMLNGLIKDSGLECVTPPHTFKPNNDNAYRIPGELRHKP